jgi:hypothetical protein
MKAAPFHTFARLTASTFHAIVLSLAWSVNAGAVVVAATGQRANECTNEAVQRVLKASNERWRSWLGQCGSERRWQ